MSVLNRNKNAPSRQPSFDGSFPRRWQAEILPKRPAILPSRHFVYPAQAEEIERGALELRITPQAPSAQPFLATCALGFSDPSVPTGIWSAPDPTALCALSGGYAYLIDTQAPERFTMIPLRPVLEVRPILALELLLFVGHHTILACNRSGQHWSSQRLSDEGITITQIEGGILHGLGWNLFTDQETPFTLELRTGQRIEK